MHTVMEVSDIKSVPDLVKSEAVAHGAAYVFRHGKQFHVFTSQDNMKGWMTLHEDAVFIGMYLQHARPASIKLDLLDALDPGGAGRKAPWAAAAVGVVLFLGVLSAALLAGGAVWVVLRAGYNLLLGG